MKCNHFLRTHFLPVLFFTCLFCSCLSHQQLTVRVFDEKNKLESGALVYVCDGAKLSIPIAWCMFYAKIRNLWSKESANEWLTRKNLPLKKVVITDNHGIAKLDIYRTPLSIICISSDFLRTRHSFEKTHLWDRAIEVDIYPNHYRQISAKNSEYYEYLLTSSLVRKENQHPEILEFLDEYRGIHGLHETNSVQIAMPFLIKSAEK